MCAGLAGLNELGGVAAPGPESGGDRIAPLMLDEEETSVGEEIFIAPRFVPFRSSLVLGPLTEGWRWRAAVAAAMRASKSRTTSGSSSGATLLLWLGLRDAGMLGGTDADAMDCDPDADRSPGTGADGKTGTDAGAGGVDMVGAGLKSKSADLVPSA